MTDVEILDVIRRCDIKKGTEIIPHMAYHFHRKFRVTFKSVNRSIYQPMEVIVLVKDMKKAGGIFRIGWESVYFVLHEEFRNQHIISNFLKTGKLNYLWPDNKTLLIPDTSDDERSKLLHLAELSGMEPVFTKLPVFHEIQKYYNS